MMTMPAASCTTQSLVVKSGSTLVVTSAHSVVLKAGFRAEAGCRFKATATSCLTGSLRQGNGFDDNFIHRKNEDTYSSNWSVAPNPSLGSDIHLNYPKDKVITQISLADIHGKIIQEQLKFQQSDNFASFTADLEKGIYFIHATTLDGVQKTLKLIKL